jgi:hypothetical protein
MTTEGNQEDSLPPKAWLISVHSVRINSTRKALYGASASKPCALAVPGVRYSGPTVDGGTIKDQL